MSAPTCSRAAAGLFRIGQEEVAKLLTRDIWSQPGADALAQLLRRARSEPEMLHGITATLSAALREAALPGRRRVETLLDEVAEAAGFAPHRAGQLPPLPPGCVLVTPELDRRPRGAFLLERFAWGDQWTGTGAEIASIGIVRLDQLPGSPGRAACSETIRATAIDPAACVAAVGFVVTRIRITRNGSRFTLRATACSSEQALRAHRPGTQAAPALLAVANGSERPAADALRQARQPRQHSLRVIAGGKA